MRSRTNRANERSSVPDYVIEPFSSRAACARHTSSSRTRSAFAVIQKRAMWPVIELNRIVSIRAGTLSPARYPSEVFELYSIPGFDRGEPELLSGSEIKSSKNNICPGDVLFSKLNPRIPRAWIVPTRDAFRQISSTEFLPLVCNPEVLDSRYLRYYLMTSRVRQRLSPSTEAATKSRSRIKPFQLLAELIPLPRLSEQRRIVDILDQAARLRRLNAIANAKADSIFQALFTRMFGDPATNPMGWRTAPLGTALTDTQYGISTRATTDRTGVPILRMNNISPAGEIMLDHLKFVNLDTRELEKHLLHPGDLLFNRTNSVDLVGKTGLWTKPDFSAVAASYLIRIRVDRDRLVPTYFWALMNTSYMKTLLRTNARRAVGMANINATELRRLPGMLPPLQLQNRYAALAGSVRRDREYRRLCTTLTDRLSCNLMDKAFSGSLTVR